LATIEAAVIAASLVRIPLGRAVALTTLALGALAGALVARWLPRASLARLRVREGPAVALVGLVVATYAMLGIAAWWKPDMSWDGLSYHLATMNFWAGHGGVAWIDVPLDESVEFHDVDVVVNAFPKGVESVGYVIVVVMGTSDPADAFDVLFLPLSALGVAALASMLGATRAMATIAGALWLLVPVNTTQTVTSHIDVSHGACVIAWLASMIAALGAVSRDEPLVPALGSTMGIALGAKGLAIGPVALGVLVLVARVAHRAHRGGWRSCASTRSPPVAHSAWGATVGAYWYIRNSLHGCDRGDECGRISGAWLRVATHRRTPCRRPLG
jgi:hypothetical protein